ncbi:subtilisin-like protein [Lactarius deliciosus]|nr:subtilisin-like protein [Lactarius deliciosus]
MHYYHCISVLSVLATGLLGGLAKPRTPPWDDIHTKHSWNAVPRNWESLGHPPSGTTIDLYIALKPWRENALVDAHSEVSEPGHPRRRWPNSSHRVQHHGISSSSISMHGGNTLILKGVSVTQANTLLSASYQLYRHVERDETVVRTVGYSLPVALHWHVLTVTPTTSFVSPRTQWPTPRNRSDRAVKATLGEPATMVSSRAKVNDVTPSFLRWLYETEVYTPNTRGENVLGIVGLLGHNPIPADITAFMQKYRSEADDATFTVVEVNGGGYDPTHPEANMDIQYAEAIAYPTPHIFYSTGQSDTGNDFAVWLDYILDQENIPQTISISYSHGEQSIPREYAIHVCEQFAELAVRGVSVLVSSGNDGIGGGTCLRDDGTVRFGPTFPGTCPYVTVVGATTDFEPEEEAVSTFLQHLGNQYQGLYNASGRGVPDIAAQAIGLPIFFNGNEQKESGIISLLNDWLISTGQRLLGFLNPWLYGRGFRGLNDIAEGSNPGCNLDGFAAIVGWDPVTGLRTPNFRKMFVILR